MPTVLVLRQTEVHGHQIHRRRLPVGRQLYIYHSTRCPIWPSALCMDMVQQDRPPGNVHELCLGNHQGWIAKAQSSSPHYSQTRLFLISPTDIHCQCQRSWRLHYHCRTRGEVSVAWARRRGLGFRQRLRMQRFGRLPRRRRSSFRYQFFQWWRFGYHFIRSRQLFQQ